MYIPAASRVLPHAHAPPHFGTPNDIYIYTGIHIQYTHRYIYTIYIYISINGTGMYVQYTHIYIYP
jgi:hypothetical protein